MLVVDDEPAAGAALRLRLERDGYEVDAATSGDEALRLLECGEYSAMLCDVRMPGMDGLALAASAVARDPRLAIILFSGAPDLDMAIAAMRAGAVDFLVKPLDHATIDRALQAGLQRRRALVESARYRERLEFEVRERTRQIGRVVEEMRETNRALGESYHESLAVLRRASAFRDNETAAHTERIRLFSVEVARALELPEESIRLVEAASPLHDIGKIGIPDGILRKPGPLTAEEFAVMKTHTVIGARIIGRRQTPLLRASREIALTHHEWWNGAGYPHGLAGEDIPLFGRIVAVVDAWDALTHVRCYKDALPAEESLDIIRRAAGTQFDPHVVEAFVERLPRLVEIEKEVGEESDGG